MRGADPLEVALADMEVGKGVPEHADQVAEATQAAANNRLHLASGR